MSTAAFAAVFPPSTESTYPRISSRENGSANRERSSFVKNRPTVSLSSPYRLDGAASPYPTIPSCSNSTSITCCTSRELRAMVKVCLSFRSNGNDVIFMGVCSVPLLGFRFPERVPPRTHACQTAADPQSPHQRRYTSPAFEVRG